MRDIVRVPEATPAPAPAAALPAERAAARQRRERAVRRRRRSARPQLGDYDGRDLVAARAVRRRDRRPHARRARPRRRRGALAAAPGGDGQRPALGAGRPAHRLPRGPLAADRLRQRRARRRSPGATWPRSPPPGARAHPRTVAWAATDGTVTVEDADTAKVLRTYRSGGVRQLAWSGDGRKLLVAGAPPRHDPRLRDRARRPASSSTATCSPPRTAPRPRARRPARRRGPRSACAAPCSSRPPAASTTSSGRRTAAGCSRATPGPGSGCSRGQQARRPCPSLSVERRVRRGRADPRLVLLADAGERDRHRRSWTSSP